MPKQTDNNDGTGFAIFGTGAPVVVKNAGPTKWLSATITAYSDNGEYIVEYDQPHPVTGDINAIVMAHRVKPKPGGGLTIDDNPASEAAPTPEDPPPEDPPREDYNSEASLSDSSDFDSLTRSGSSSDEFGFGDSDDE